LIYLVVGHMRSGTSMMMSCLEAGGLPVVRSESRDRLNAAHSDQHYRPNPTSLYEPDERAMRVPGWPRQHDGHALKVVAPLLGRLAAHEYRVVFMRRDSEEIRQSYEGAFGGRVTAQQIETVIAEALRTLNNRRDVHEIIELQYGDVIDDPVLSLASLGWPIDVQAAAAVVDPSLYRFRLNRLTVGA
jgi:hypothetical protein